MSLTARKFAAATLVITLIFSLLAFRYFVDLRVIPQSQQRYPTLGDWWFDSLGWHFRISEQPDRRYEWLLFVHEFTEASLCRLMGVSQTRVDAFDIAYEQRRKGKSIAIPGKSDNLLFDEPGDDPAAPYHYEHVIASALERAAAVMLFVRWTTYNETLDREPLCDGAVREFQRVSRRNWKAGGPESEPPTKNRLRVAKSVAPPSQQKQSVVFAPGCEE